MAGITKRTTAFDDENLSGRSQKLYFEVTEEENYTYYGNHEVDFNKRTSIDCEGIDAHELNQKIIFHVFQSGVFPLRLIFPEIKISFGFGGVLIKKYFWREPAALQAQFEDYVNLEFFSS